jgi:hypothetical protein
MTFIEAEGAVVDSVKESYVLTGSLPVSTCFFFFFSFLWWKHQDILGLGGVAQGVQALSSSSRTKKNKAYLAVNILII